MLDISNITVTFNKGTPDAKTALEDFSVHVNKGDFITIIGANGAGKSTLFNAICGNFIVDKGRIVLDGQDVTFTPDHVRAKSIGRLFQDPMRGSAPNMSIEENLALAAGRGSWFSMISRQDRALFRERLSLLDMGLEDRMKQPVGLLSGGQRQALTLMMATFNPPKLLLLDEHTAALDPGTAEKVLELTKRIVSESSITCMMVTHNMQSAIDLGNRLFMLNQGHLILDVSGQEKSALTVPTLVDMFRRKSGSELQTDRLLLTEQD